MSRHYLPKIIYRISSNKRSRSNKRLPQIYAWSLRCRRYISVDVAAGTAWVTSRTNENMRRRQPEPSQSFTAGMPAELHSSQLRCIAGMPEVKTGMTDVAGYFCSHIGTVAVPAAMSQMHRRNMRTRNPPPFCLPPYPLPFYLT